MDWFSALFFGACAIEFLTMILRRALGVLVDGEGITPGTSPVRREVPGRLVPWADVEAVVLYEQFVPSAVKQTMTYLGLRRRPGSAPLPGSPGQRSLRASEVLIPGIPREVLAASVPVNGWRLDEERFVQVIEYNTPQLRVEDHRG